MARQSFALPVRLSNRRTRAQDAASQQVKKAFYVINFSPFVLCYSPLSSTNVTLQSSLFKASLISKSTQNPNQKYTLPSNPSCIPPAPWRKGNECSTQKARIRLLKARLGSTKGPDQITQCQVGNQGPCYRLVGKRGGNRLPLPQPRLNPLLSRRLLVGFPVHGNDGANMMPNEMGHVLRRDALLAGDGC